MENHYAATRASSADAFWEAALDQLDVTLNVAPSDPATVLPSEGPVVVVANHPFGVLDGLAICHLVSQVRSDFRILVNSVLCRDERVAHHFLPIDFSGSGAAHDLNVRSVKAAFGQLHDDGVVVVFPAGGVATAARPLGPVNELSWKPLVARLIRKREASVLPIYFHGHNSRLFQIVSQMSLTLRLSLLLREALQKEGDTLSVRLGAPIPYADLPRAASPEELTDWLRTRTLGLTDPTDPCTGG